MIPYGRHSLNESDILEVVKVLRGDWLTTGPLVEKFEQALSEVAGAPCISVSSGTAALHCAYAAIALTEGDEVITSPITFIATQATAALFGAKIVFADVQLDTGNIDPAAVEAAITNRTKAIVAVDFAGHPSELDELRVIADKYGVFLIEDAAHSIGSTYKGKSVGSIADLTTFSFFPTKNLTTGEGGAVASKNPYLLEKAKRFSRQGLVRSREEFVIKDQGPWHQEVHEFGLNYRLPDILCALGLSQINRLPEFKVKRTELFNLYNDELADTGFTAPAIRDYVEPTWHLYPARVKKSERLSLFNKLRGSGIGVQINYMPAYWHPVFLDLGHKRGECPNAEEFYDTEISLPMWPDLLSDSKLLNKVISVLKEV
jgi:dTDP-4-amino-4,6-dideoxygalactose transaminase